MTKEKAIKYMPYLLKLQIEQVYYRPLTLLTSSLWTALLVRGFFFDEDAVCCSLSMALLRASELTGGSGWIVGTAPGTRSRCFFNPISFIKHLSKLSDEKWLPQMTEFSDGSEKFALFTCTNLILSSHPSDVMASNGTFFGSAQLQLFRWAISQQNACLTELVYLQ